METYSQLKTRQSEELNAFPMKFAFNQEQFKSGMESLGLTVEDTDKVTSVPGGGFLLKTDSKSLFELFARHSTELEESMQDDVFLLQAFMYELNNHEYCITYDVTDTLDSLGLTLEEVEASPRMKKALKTAKIRSR